MRSSHAAFARLAAADPLPDEQLDLVVDRAWSEQLLQRIASGPVPPVAARRSGRRPLRLLATAVAVAVLSAAPAYAIGRTLVDWLAAEPAPPAVVTDFGKYAPQLGFDPEPGKAVRVAEDEHVRLFVTTNRQGTYCFIVSTRADGGTCVSRAVADAELVAAYVSDVAAGEGTRLRVVVGRTKEPTARSVRFTGPDGERVERSVGAGGFFVAGIHDDADTSACAGGDWAPSFVVTDGEGRVVAERSLRLALARGDGAARVCQFGFFDPQR